MAKPIQKLKQPMVATANSSLEHHFNLNVINKINELVDAVNSLNATAIREGERIHIKEVIKPKRR